MRKELLKGLSEEQIKKVEACKNSEELLNLAKAEGIELTDEQLEAVSGGCKKARSDPYACPDCGTKAKAGEVNYRVVYNYVKCRNCGKEYYV